MSEMAISVRGLHHRLGGFELDIPVLQLEQGYVLGLLGRNGAGKSTTLLTLLGLIHAAAGEIQVLGMPMPAAAVEVRRGTGFVPEQAAFYEHLNAAQTAALVAPFYPSWDQSLFDEHLTRLEIEPRKPVRSYSKGMRVKLSLALALSHRPRLLVLDEPTAGLDPVVRRQILAEIAGIVADGGHAAVISSHITSDLEIADYIGIIEGGRLIEHDDREQLRERWRKVSGTMASDQAGLDRLFVSVHRNESVVAGVTNRFSPAWREEARQAGLQVEAVAQLTLDEILAYATGEGRAAGGTGEAE